VRAFGGQLVQPPRDGSCWGGNATISQRRSVALWRLREEGVFNKRNESTPIRLATVTVQDAENWLEALQRLQVIINDKDGRGIREFFDTPLGARSFVERVLWRTKRTANSWAPTGKLTATVKKSMTTTTTMKKKMRRSAVVQRYAAKE